MATKSWKEWRFWWFDPVSEKYWDGSKKKPASIKYRSIYRSEKSANKFHPTNCGSNITTWQLRGECIGATSAVTKNQTSILLKEF